MTEQEPGNDIALPSDQPREAPSADVARPPSDHPVSELVAWAFDASQAHRIAISLSQTDFVPRAMKGKPDQVTGAILTGNELGLKPMASLRSVDIIQGTPGLRALTMRALVQQAGHTIIVVETSDEKCVMKGRRNGDEEWTTVTWTMARAIRAGLSTKDIWQQYPDEMLLARCTGQLCRLIAADVILGVPYTSEELTDIDPAAAKGPRVTLEQIMGEAVTEQPTAPPAVEQRASEPTTPAAAEPAPDQPTATPREEQPAAPADDVAEATVEPDPPAAEQPPADPPAGPDPMEPKIRPRQTGAIHALATKLGLEFNPKKDRTDYLAELSAVVGRDITSSTELTTVEAGRVIEAWQATVDRMPTGPTSGAWQ